ncbi:MAG TPA: DUF885 domain-containing protein [Allosphingosinicella sp.]|nr:DUF885 domain-containing protein [Allosphingosinicella sp.]
MRKLIAALLLGVATPAAATPAEDLQRVLADHWQWVLRNDPVTATRLGVRDYDKQLPDISLAARDREAREAQALLARLDAIPAAQLGAEDRTNQALLRRNLSEQIESNRFGQRMVLYSQRGGWQQSFAGMASALPFQSAADYESYLARLEGYPRLNQEAMRITRRSVAEGYTLPCEVMKDADRTISGVITDTPEKSRFYEPFTRTRPSTIAEADWAALQQRARTIITGTLFPQYREHLAFYQREVAPRCRQSVAISAQPGGRDFYAFRIRQMTTTDMTAEQIHQLGLREVARIRAEMEDVARKAGFPTREAFIQDLRTNPVHYPKTGEQLMQEVARLAKEIDGHMPRLFGKLPRLPYTIREIPAEIAAGTTTAYYNDGSLEAGLPGVYFVNTSKLDQRPLWEVPALTVHEAVPGHHQQISIQQELDLPEFRRHATFFTAFVEGWGLYSERLGIEMGLYNTPARDMGRLSYEMWRATRLVVDTGIHAFGWSRQRAIDYMLENSALSRANIEAEVNRYITNPGQALAYKIGELKIRELRTQAEQALGARFDLRRFHDAVLGQGSVPLDVLEAQVKAWIASERAKPQPSTRSG